VVLEPCSGSCLERRRSFLCALWILKALLVTLALAAMSYRFLEFPFLTLGHRFRFAHELLSEEAQSRIQRGALADPSEKARAAGGAGRLERRM
jgi:peptidoglycan/LPS O-acetylase OafA/YrhL